MRELQRKQKIKRILYSIPSLILFAVLCFFLVKGVIGIMGKERESRERVRELEDRAEMLVSRESELEGEIARLQTEEGIKEEIKEKFSVTHDGEYVAIIVDEKGKSTTTSTSTVEWLKNSWQKVKNLWKSSESGYNVR